MHTSVLNSRVILIVCKRVQQTVLDWWRRKGLRGNDRWRLRTKCISQVNSSVTWANTMPTLVINCRVVLIYSIVRLICHDQIVYEEIIFCKTSFRTFLHNVTERRERFNAANGRRPKSSGTTTWILWMQGVGLNECLIQKKNENLITNKTNHKTK